VEHTCFILVLRRGQGNITFVLSIVDLPIFQYYHFLLTHILMIGQAISTKNKNNSKNIKHPHTLGRKSFARKRKEVVIIDFLMC
jgi:hypothetical protein